MNAHVLALSLTLATLSSTASAGTPADDTTPWVADFDRAAEIARRDGKALLVDFTGSDWCSWCIRLDREVFGKDAFLSRATERFVLVELDFPKGTEARMRVPNPARNAELQAKYEIRSFPSILVLNADGELLGRTGYRPGGAEAYAEHVESLLARGLEAVGIAQRLEANREEASLPDLRAALAFLGEVDLMETPAARRLLGPVRQALESPVLELEALTALLRAGISDADLQARVLEHDPKNRRGIFELSVLAQFENVTAEAELPVACKRADELLALAKVHDRDVGVAVFATAAHWCQSFLGDAERARGFAKRAISLGLENDELRGRLQAILDA